jgi:DNA-binding NarL/FixJ family response regulator
VQTKRRDMPNPPKQPTSRAPRVALLSPHVLALEVLERALSDTIFDVTPASLDSNPFGEDSEPRVPEAPTYVVDGYMSRPATEAVIARIRANFPDARILLLGAQFDEESTFSFLRLGVKGLLAYREVQESLPVALDVIHDGGFWVPRNILSRFMDSVLAPRPASQGLKILSGREREVLDAILENLSNKEIASRLHIAERTVKFHVSNLLTKYGVEGRQELILQCLRLPSAST